jgi:hypothetical protein
VMPSEETHYLSPAAERMRRHRDRRRKGLVYLGIELRVTEINRLVALGYLENRTTAMILRRCSTRFIGFSRLASSSTPRASDRPYRALG